MSGIAGIERFRSPADLPEDASRLLDSETGLFASRAWWDVVWANAIPEGAEPGIVVVRLDGRAAALIPVLRQHGALGVLTTPYSCDYTPVFAPGADREAAVALFGRGVCRRAGTFRFDALPAEWPGLPALESGAARAGLRPLRFDHFGNWTEDVSGQSWDVYLRGRQGALRETIRRRLRRAEALPTARFELLAGSADMDRAGALFESVYARSWKEPEPFPAFNVALMRSLAASGRLRFGAWSIGEQPVAVQIWAVGEGRAIVLKLAHDEAFKPHSPGTVLTALMLRHLLDEEQVPRIDFGRGDDPYKQGWATERRQRVGLLLANPWHPAGLAALLRHRAGRLRAGLREAQAITL